MSKAKEYGEQLFEAAVLTAGAVGVSYASRKLTKLALAFGLSAIGVKMLKDKKILPDNPFKT